MLYYHIIILASNQFDYKFCHISKPSTFLLQKEQHQKAAESDESSQSSARPKWDSPFNRALNILKKVPVDKPPSYTRAHGVGDGASWKMCYHE